MRRVEEITGETRVAQNIARALIDGGSRSAAIIGPEGSGKSRAASVVGRELEGSYRVVLRRGDSLLSSSSEAMLVGGTGRPSTEQVGDAVLDVAELIIDGHIPFSRTLRRLFKLNWQVRKVYRPSASIHL
jgi:ABC-type enterochelin transport system ATPase subunit